MFFIMILTTFLARVKPPSTMAKPACIRNTMKPAMVVHMVSTTTRTSGTGLPSILPSSAYTMAGNSIIASASTATVRKRLGMNISSGLARLCLLWRCAHGRSEVSRSLCAVRVVSAEECG